MTKSMLLLPVLLMSVGVGPARAGERADGEVVITHPRKATDQAQGSVLAARESADGVQVIGCSLSTAGGGSEPEGRCFARDAFFDSATCVTRDAMQIKIISTIGSHSHIT